VRLERLNLARRNGGFWHRGVVRPRSRRQCGSDGGHYRIVRRHARNRQIWEPASARRSGAIAADQRQPGDLGERRKRSVRHSQEWHCDFFDGERQGISLHAGTALIRPNSDAATVGSVTILSPKELAVSCSHGALAISVEDDTKVVAEGTAYRVVLDPDDPQGQDTNNPPPVFTQKNPRKSGRDRFLMFVLIFAGIGTAIGIYLALESPDRP